MTRRPRPRRASACVAAGATLVAALAGCGSTPDTTLHPQPPTVSYAPQRHPFQGARLFQDDDTAAARWQKANGAQWLDPITRTPQARWLNSTEDLASVPTLVRQARQQRALLVLVAYNVPNRGCSGFKEGAPTGDDYDRWIDRLVTALDDEHAAIVVEPDAVAADCFDDAQAAHLKRAVERLSAAGHAAYIDAGHSRWKSSGEIAARLLRVGIEHAEGFAVNVSNRRSTDEAYQWARELSDLLGGRDFVIDTSRNGTGPPPDDPGRDDEWCNPQQQALGRQPTTDAGQPGLAALLWIKRPGESDGICGGEQTYLFSPGQARNLIVNASDLPEIYRKQAAAYKP
jgi:endoglucanase